MPRPTSAQIAYGSVTVVLSTLAMLLLSGTSSATGVAVVVLGALALGLVVASLLPLPRRSPRPARAARPPRTVARGPRAPRQRAGSAPARVGEHSLHG
ncbi:hypothetical protein [Streptomyces caatingaensis]|uniref:Membrane protein n=1 Tax=Streptomyces caatingaensis TaxID=1678637 RepID=A0A0K9X7E3_9ACTN|nr:hypothetical protein [Streptomyces caatingaensis]KNB49359.1 membrane protein [Streptomyces caatingaensis]